MLTRDHRPLARGEAAELAAVAAQVEEELRGRIKKASPARVALAKLKVARLREGLSLGEIAEKSGIDRGNLSKLENSVDNVELDALCCGLADGARLRRCGRPRLTKLAGGWREGGRLPHLLTFGIRRRIRQRDRPQKACSAGRVRPPARSAIGDRGFVAISDRRSFRRPRRTRGAFAYRRTRPRPGGTVNGPSSRSPKVRRYSGSTASGTKDTEPLASPMFAPPG